ncbi:hypothetical protein [Calothrix sp. 336/3]|uniref:hypothetical protein n=1 Tax=Calothrix sp. 336/3 TaxID=1337936 RepID=UPI0004E43E6F|nr:hypothetical protein [Calothrix sp. 336/3]AKG21248.1 hypothetical protein IJ00_08015 [Calothrix sp. 336/3]
MPSAPLNKVYFPIYRKTSGDTGRSLNDPFGVFSCRLSTARFLDIESKIISGVLIKERKAYTRSLTLADGTTITATPTAGTEIAASEIVLPIGGRGSRSVILTTGKLIADTKRTVGKGSAYHTLTFRFPGWATIANISEALGELIPANKIKETPTSDDIRPYFKVVGGRTYPITLESDAETSTDVQVPENSTELEALQTQADIKKTRKKAGTT